MWPFPVFGSAALALIVERFTGYPNILHAAIGHPVEWMGWLIERLDAALNDPHDTEERNRLRGVVALGVLLLAVALPAWLIARVVPHWTIEALIATVFIAQRSMREHVEAVYSGLGRSLQEGREAVCHIVGRDTRQLDESGVSRAALESLAENASDGIVAPVFWFALLGLPGVALYKAINTADSMIGYKTERHLHFGWAAAKLDDLVNLPASRLTGFLIAFASAWASKEACKAALDAMWRDASKHQSPNAGWPEAAMAGGLGVKLGGPRSYHGAVAELAWMGDGREELSRADIQAGLKTYGRAMFLLFLLLVFSALVAALLR